MDALPDPRMRKKGYSFVSFPVSWLDDRPVAQLSHDALGAYVRLYFLAGRFNQSGILQDERGTLELGDLAYLLRCDQAELEKLMSLLESLSLIDKVDGAWRVKSFTEEQINLNERRARWAKSRQEQRQKVRDAEDEPYSDSKTDRKKDRKPKEKGKETPVPDEEVVGEVKIERPKGVLEDTSNPTAATSASSGGGGGGSVRSEKLFHDVYNLVRKMELPYNTENIQVAIQYVKDFIEYHNQITGNNWTWCNPEMVVEFCDREMVRDRWMRELEKHHKAGIWEPSKLPDYLKQMVRGEP